jgi:shikimate dehydrogenase
MLRTGLLGYPIDHSLSPAIHNAAYAALGLDWKYELCPCEDRVAFERLLAEAASGPAPFIGFNVTTPHKSAAYEACTEHSPICALTTSANVLTFLPGVPSEPVALHGDDTDGRGLVASLEREGGVTVAGSSVVLCGTGPVALSALAALVRAGAASINIATRDVHRGLKRVELLRGRLANVNGEGAFLPEMRVIGYAQAAEALEVAGILIDATTLGMASDDEPVIVPRVLREGLVVLDVVYGLGESALLRAARATGACAIDGLGMLVEQAALTIEVWAQAQGLELTAPRSLMHQTARAGA